MKNIIKRVLPPYIIRIAAKVRQNLFDGYAIKSYSQEGEDMILRRIFERKKNGFFVDVGAHHPRRFSNTHYFYKNGWHGINIDAMPGSMKQFNKMRPRDTNLELGISGKRGLLTYYMFNEPALNGFSKELTENRKSNTDYYIIGEKKINVLPLKEVLDKHAAGRYIDFLSIDVEGLDQAVLLSNDWNKYRPHIVLVESLGNDNIEEMLYKNETVCFMREKEYSILGKSYNTIIFKDNRLK